MNKTEAINISTKILLIVGVAIIIYGVIFLTYLDFIITVFIGGVIFFVGLTIDAYHTWILHKNKPKKSERLFKNE